jgi:hypothetical protein
MIIYKHSNNYFWLPLVIVHSCLLNLTISLPKEQIANGRFFKQELGIDTGHNLVPCSYILKASLTLVTYFQILLFFMVLIYLQYYPIK